MTSKTKQIIMAAIGAYLVYTGISLVKDTIVGEPKNQILFILVGVFFALFGLATIIWNIRTIVKETKAEIQGTTAGAEENEDGEEAAKKVSSGKGVADVHVGADTKEEKSADKEERKETAAEEKAEDGEKEKKKGRRNMRRRRFVALGLAAIMAMTAMTGCGGSSSAKTDSTTGGDKKQAEATSGKEKITLRIGSGHSESNPWITALEDYFVKNVSERVSEETNYEIDWVKSYGGSVISLGNELQGVQDGLVDIGCTILVFEASRLPLQDMVYSMPFSCSDPLIVAETIKQMYEKYPEFTSIYEDSYNQKFVGIGVSDPYGFFSTKEVKSLEDVNGMKIGAAGINLSWIEGSGAVGVQTSLNDTYQNLQTNVCQATIQPTHSCVNLKVYEVAPYYLDANFNVVPFNAITVNMDTWNDLPEDVQNIISEVGEGYLDYESEYINTIHEEDIKALEEQGCTVTTLSREEQEKWAASLPDVVNGLVKSLDDAGYNGSEIVEDYYEILESKGVERVRDWKISE